MKEQQQQKGSRGNETGCKAFTFQGAKIFDDLPDNLHTETSLFKFKGSNKDTGLDFMLFLNCK